MNLWEKARAGLPLTPAERATLKLIQSLLISAGIAAVVAANQFLAQPGAVDWSKFWLTVALTLAFSLATGAIKWIKASFDPTLGDALGQLLASVEERTGIDPGGLPENNGKSQGASLPTDGQNGAGK